MSDDYADVSIGFLFRLLLQTWHAGTHVVYHGRTAGQNLCSSSNNSIYIIYTVSQKKLCKIVSIRTLWNFHQF